MRNKDATHEQVDILFYCPSQVELLIDSGSALNRRIPGRMARIDALIVFDDEEVRYAE